MASSPEEAEAEANGGAAPSGSEAGNALRQPAEDGDPVAEVARRLAAAQLVQLDGASEGEPLSEVLRRLAELRLGGAGLYCTLADGAEVALTSEEELFEALAHLLLSGRPLALRTSPAQHPEGSAQGKRCSLQGHLGQVAWERLLAKRRRIMPSEPPQGTISAASGASASSSGAAPSSTPPVVQVPLVPGLDSDRDQVRELLAGQGGELLEQLAAARSRGQLVLAHFVVEGSDVHSGVECDLCGVAPLRGIRYKCTSCDDYDLCSRCFRLRAEAHDPGHSFQEFRHPVVSRELELP